MPEEVAKKVLLVDDEPIILNLGSAYCDAMGVAYEIACDGQKALEIFRANYEAFGVLVTDQDMPVMDGIMLAREIRVLAPNLPIIFITGRPTLALEAVANELGATVLAKPVSLNIFKNAILTALAFVPS